MKICCICDHEDEEDMVELVYLRYGKVLRFPVCSPSCAEILTNRQEKKHEEAQAQRAPSEAPKPRGDRHRT